MSFVPTYWESFAVALEKDVTLAILKREGIQAPTAFSHQVDKPLSHEGVRIPYIDDFNSINTKRALVNRDTHLIAVRLTRSNQTVAEDKNI